MHPNFSHWKQSIRVPKAIKSIAGTIPYIKASLQSCLCGSHIVILKICQSQEIANLCYDKPPCAYWSFQVYFMQLCCHSHAQIHLLFVNLKELHSTKTSLVGNVDKCSDASKTVKICISNIVKFKAYCERSSSFNIFYNAWWVLPSCVLETQIFTFYVDQILPKEGLNQGHIKNGHNQYQTAKRIQTVLKQVNVSEYQQQLQHYQTTWKRDHRFCWGMETVLSFFFLTSFSIAESD